MKDLVETYQCPGCVSGCNTECGEYKEGFGCQSHAAGTFVNMQYRIMLGLPKGFNRSNERSPISIYESFPAPNWEYDMFNIPVWKMLDDNGNTLVRGVSPRTNYCFIHIYKGDIRDQIDCLEITQEQSEEMD